MAPYALAQFQTAISSISKWRGGPAGCEGPASWPFICRMRTGGGLLSPPQAQAMSDTPTARRVGQPGEGPPPPLFSWASSGPAPQALAGTTDPAGGAAPRSRPFRTAWASRCLHACSVSWPSSRANTCVRSEAGGGVSAPVVRAPCSGPAATGSVHEPVIRFNPLRLFFTAALVFTCDLVLAGAQQF